MKIYNERAAAGLCINDQRDMQGPEHGPPVKARRCQICWDKKLESARRRRKDPTAPDLRRRGRRKRAVLTPREPQ